MKYSYNVFFIILWGLFISCSSDDPAVDSNEGKDDKEDPLPDKGTLFADFETYDTTPYFFRYGNSGSSKIDDYYPRWAYSHIVIDNPVQSEENTSSKVLEYTSMEARNYGLKFRFSETVDIDELRGIRFRIYQPANVIGKETWKGTSKAVSQQLGVKLIGRFNSVNDYEQEEGVLLTNSLVVAMKSVKSTEPYISLVIFYKITNLFATDTFRSSRQIRNFRQLLFVVHSI